MSLNFSHPPLEGDITSIVNAALNKPPYKFYIPYGTYRVDGTIYIGAEKCLELDHNVVLHRQAEYSNSNLPIVHLTGNNACLFTNSYSLLYSDNKTPQGVVHIGPINQDSNRVSNINNVSIRNVTLRGNNHNDSVGLYLSSNQKSNVNSSNYRSFIQNVKIREVSTGCLVDELCNAHRFYDVDFYLIKKYSILSRKNTQNTFFGGFTHLSKELDTVIKLEEASYNLLYGIQAEPGSGKWYDIDRKSVVCTIIGHDNCPNRSIDNGINSTILTHGDLKLNSVSTNV